MAKKGGQQQLQADIQNDEEFEKFLDRKGLLVMDVYTEWCGPCLAMVGSLKKIKLELGGDNLQLAICKSDTIEALKRFRNKSEPTWLFASHGKIVNVIFGTNVPKLMQVIAHELEIEAAYNEGKGDRIFYNKDELLPIEQHRLNVVLAAETEAKRIEQEEAERKRREYLAYVTSEITNNLPECGITIFGPHVSRDIFKKISEPAENLGLTSRDRRTTQIVPENIEVLHFQCDNPLDEEVLEYMFNKDLLICMWKSERPDTNVEEVLQTFVQQLTEPQPVLDEFGVPSPDATIPPIIEALEVEPAKEKMTKDTKAEEVKEKSEDDNLQELDLKMASMEDENEASVQEGEEKAGEVVEKEQPPEPPKVEEPVVQLLAPEPESEESVVKISIPAVWTPSNRVTNAAGIYLYFRIQTEPFLPPDPVPDPPHLAIAFEAYKRKDILELCDQYKDSILTYGYFDSSNPNAAKLIANSTKKYETRSQTIQDKLVLKVAKVTSHALLALSAQGPTHVSQNTVVGQKECRKFFPEGYKTGEDEELESVSQVDVGGKKKKKKKKKTEGADSGDSGLGMATSDADAVEESAELEGDEQQGDEQAMQEDDGFCEGEECPPKGGGDAGGDE